MEMTCRKCNFTAGYLEFIYLCKSGWPACGEADLRRCPRCGTDNLFSRTEALEKEDKEIDELVARLDSISLDADDKLLNEAKEIIFKLREINRRWNIPELKTFIRQRQKELKLGVYVRLTGTK